MRLYLRPIKGLEGYTGISALCRTNKATLSSGSVVKFYESGIPTDLVLEEQTEEGCSVVRGNPISAKQIALAPDSPLRPQDD